MLCGLDSKPSMYFRPCYFSSTVTRRRQDHILYRARDKQIALKPFEGFVRFRPRLWFMFASPSIKTPIPRWETWVYICNKIDAWGNCELMSYMNTCSCLRWDCWTAHVDIARPSAGQLSDTCNHLIACPLHSVIPFPEATNKWRIEGVYHNIRGRGKSYIWHTDLVFINGCYVPYYGRKFHS